MSKPDPKVIAELQERARELCEGAFFIGQQLADYTEHGSVISLETGRADRKVVVTIATNDAADHLRKWTSEQSAARRDAIRGLGLDLTYFDSDDPGSSE